jgi:release factor glutamine methyltransferase
VVELIQGDLRDGLPGGPYDLIASNPPYVEPDELDGLQPEVREFEPRLALVGDGLPELVARGARAALVPGGALLMEIHADHAERCLALLDGLGFVETRLTPDLTGRDRLVEGRLP